MSAAEHLSQAQMNHVYELHGRGSIAKVHPVSGDVPVGVAPGFEKPTNMKLTAAGNLRVGSQYMIGKYGERTPIQ